LNELDRYLTKQDAIKSLEIIHNCFFCNNKDNFYNLLNNLKKLIDYQYDICALAVFNNSNSLESTDILNISYPDELMSIYTTNQWNNIDPLHKVNFTQFKLQYWSDTFKEHGAPRNMKSVFDDFNIRDGYAHGVRTKSGNKGSIFCIAGNNMKKEKRTELILELLVPHYHETLNRILTKNVAEKTILSLREKEILKWISKGKNTWDVSVILKISERTVKFHIDNIMKKLDAVNRTHAVAIALRENLIALD